MKLYHILFLTGLFLSMPVNAMEKEKENDDSNHISQRVIRTSTEKVKDIEKEKNNTHTPEESKTDKEQRSHWGLYHCTAGIKEYFWRTFLCGYGYDYTSTDRAWVTYDLSNKKILRTSDCLIMDPCHWCLDESEEVCCCKINGCFYNNPIYGIACFPYRLLHLIAELPYYIYHKTPNQRPGTDLCTELYCCCIPLSLCYIYCGEHECIWLGDPQTDFGVQNDETHEYRVAYSCCLDEKVLKWSDPSSPGD